MPTVVLITDIDNNALRFFKNVLKPACCLIMKENARSALSVLATCHVDIVLSAMNLSGMDGLHFCKAIKSNAEFSCIPVILYDKNVTAQKKINGIRHGADIVMEYRSSKDLFTSHISGLLEIRNKLKKYFTNHASNNENAISNIDLEFIELVNENIDKLGEAENPNVVKLARILNMSRITLYRKIKAASGLTPIEFINASRLKKAAVLLAARKYKVYEVAYMAGYNSHSSFSRHFYNKFRMSPTTYIQSKEKQSIEGC